MRQLMPNRYRYFLSARVGFEMDFLVERVND